MSKSIKFKNNNYLDSSSIAHNRKTLKEILETGHIYPLKEQKIGVWFNGKPIYRVVLNGATTSDSYTKITVSNVLENIVSLSGFVLDTSGLTNTIPMYWDDNLKIVAQIFPDGDIYLTYGDSFKNSSYVLVVEYTKTTD